MNIELRHLRYFVAAVEEGSLQGAARRMHVAQPALSRQIRDLEGALGAPLFERQARGVSLTPAGTALHRDALAILQSVDAATQRARSIGLDSRRRVRLGLVRTGGKYAFVHQALSGFMKDRPEVGIDFTRAPSPELVERLRAGDLDLALLYERQLDPRAFGQRVIHYERYVLAVHPRHRLARRKAVHLGDLAGEPMVWLARQNSTEIHDVLLQQCRLHGLEPAIGHEAGSHEEQLELVAVTGGACLTLASAQLSTAPGQVLYRPIPDFDLEVQLRLAWRKGLTVGSASALQKGFMRAIDAHQADVASGAAAWTRTPDGTAVARSS